MRKKKTFAHFGVEATFQDVRSHIGVETPALARATSWQRPVHGTKTAPLAMRREQSRFTQSYALEAHVSSSTGARNGDSSRRQIPVRTRTGGRAYPGGPHPYRGRVA